MATKTISLDLEAYRRLKGEKLKGESFSDVIKRVIQPPLDLETWFRDIQAHPLSRKAIKAIERQIAERGRSVSQRGSRGLPRYKRAS